MKIFHHNDMDGYSSASLVMIYNNPAIELYQALKDCFKRMELFVVNYEPDVREKFDKVVPKEEVWIVDYSFTEDTKDILDDLLEKTDNVIWIDHHASSLSLIEKYPKYKDIKGIRDSANSGAYNTWLYLHTLDSVAFSDTIPEYIKLISDYDCWHHKLDPDSTYFKLGYDMYHKIQLDTLISLYKDYYYNSDQLMKSIISDGMIIKEYIDTNYAMVKNSCKYETTISGHKMLVVNGHGNSWVFGDDINKYPICCLWYYNGKSYKYSLYSEDPNVRCDKIAETFGGGGHPGAAGFYSDHLVFLPENK